MPSLKFLVLHGAGSSADIMSSQLSPLMKHLSAANIAEFDFAEGTLETKAGPGLIDFYEGPFYSFFAWPPTSCEKDEISIQNAYDDLQDLLEEDGPYDGIVGFSHGGTLLAGFLEDFASRNPGQDLPCRCAVFVSSFPPFRMGEEGKPVFRTAGLGYLQSLPTLHVMGKADFVYEHSKELYGLCRPESAIMVTHDKGHELPTAPKAVKDLVAGFQLLNNRLVCGW